MMDTYNLSEFGSFTRARQIAVTLLFALSLAGPSRLWGQCQQSLINMSYDKGSIIALTADSTGLATATVTLNCPYSGYPQIIYISDNSKGVLTGGGAASCSLGIRTCTFGEGAVQVASQTSFTVTASLYLTNSTVSASLAVVPLTARVQVSPARIVGGSGQQATFTLTTNGPVRSTPPYYGQSYYTVHDSCNVLGGVGGQIAPGTSSVTGSVGANAVTQDTLCSFTLSNYIWGGPTTSGSIMVTPATVPPGGPVNVADQGRCKQCQLQAGAPLNVTNGNVWIEERDFSVPGLGGGLDLTRTWNSLWLLASPPSLAGMFGLGWQSTYEEQLTLQGSQSLIYWRGDGSGWTFTYNSVLNSYSLSSPPNERAQLASNLTGGFTLTLPDGTQKVFNGQNLLAALIDRNHNQTTLAYDTYNRLASVTSPGGSTLTFTYGDPNNPLQATTAQDSVGTVATYTYDSSSRLTKVSYPDGSALNFTYDPNSSMILSVTDSQGKLLESHTYDAQNRGLTSARAYGVDSVSLSY
jgi:YD repeat-containing protein